MTQEDIRAIGALMDQKLEPVIKRLDALEESVDQKLTPIIKRLDALEESVDQKLAPVIKRLDTLEENQITLIKRLDVLEESQEETRNGVNTLISWAEKVSMAATFPLPDIDD